MARKLPWKRPESDRAIKSDSPAVASPSRPPIVKAEATPVRRERVAASPAASSANRSPFAFPSRIRSPSTSPPPEPPKQEFMLPGLDKDDRYRMVEDEFLATAQRFTAHLHRAEYDRLKRVAKSQNAATIRAIERPVVAGLRRTNTAKRRQEAVRKVASQRKVLGDDSGAADDLPWMGTSLQGLMDAPRIEPRAIAASSGPTSAGTRAAAGFTSTRGEAAELQRSGAPPSRARPWTSSVKPQVPVRHYLGSSHSATDVPIDVDDDDDDENDPFGINKRRVRREISREQLRKSSEMPPPRQPPPDSIPSFLR